MSKSSWDLWKPGLRNGLTKGNDCFLLVCFGAMFNLLVVVKENEDSVNRYYFLWALTTQDGGRRKEAIARGHSHPPYSEPTRGNSDKEGPSHASTFTVIGTGTPLVAFCHHGFNISCLCHALCCSGTYGMLRSFCTQGAEPGVREIFRLFCSSN